MNYGSTGYLSEGLGSFYFTYQKEIFSAFNLSNKSKLYGLYYPCPIDKVEIGYREATIKHDFLITPISPEFWKVCARIQIFIKNRPHTLKDLYSFLKDKNISIIHAESTRSTYRYATWSAHIVFNDLLEPGKSLEYNEKLNSYNETIEEVKKLKQSLKKFKKKDNNSFLFAHHNQFEIDASANSSLAYFANYIEKNLKYSPFTLEVRNSNFYQKMQVLVVTEDFRKNMIELKEMKPGLLPATTFSELDTKGHILRTVVISKDDAKRFFKVSIKYFRSSTSATCIGIVHTLTNVMPRGYNIWHIYNRIKNHDPQAEEGEIIFLIEDTHYRTIDVESNNQFSDHHDADDYLKWAYKRFSAVITDYNKKFFLKESEFMFKKLKVLSLPEMEVVKEILIEDSKARSNREFDYDVFISYSHLDSKYVDKFEKELLAKDIVLCRDIRNIQFGEDIAEAIFKGMKNCREICIFISANSIDKEWVIMERGAAFILNKPITAIRLDNSEVPEILQIKRYVQWDKLNERKDYINEIRERIDKSLAVKYAKVFSK